MKSETEMKPLLVNLKQLKQLLGVSEQSVERLIRSRGFPRPIDAGISRLLWKLSDVEEWVKNCRVKRW